MGREEEESKKKKDFFQSGSDDDDDDYDVDAHLSRKKEEFAFVKPIRSFALP